MENLEVLNTKIELIKKRLESQLLSKHSANKSDLQYWSVNFKSWVLDPFIETTLSEIDELQFNKYLISKLKTLIADLEFFISDELPRRKKYNGINKQESYIKSFIDAIQNKIAQIQLALEKEDEDSDFSTDNTALTKKETALLLLYLQDVKAILPYTHITDSKLSEAFSILTGYKPEQLRKVISGNARQFRNEITTRIDNYNKLKDTLKMIISYIDRDMSNFN